MTAVNKPGSRASAAHCARQRSPTWKRTSAVYQCRQGRPVYACRWRTANARSGLILRWSSVTWDAARIERRASGIMQDPGILALHKRAASKDLPSRLTTKPQETAKKKAQPIGLRQSSTKGGGFGGICRTIAVRTAKILLPSEAKCKRFLLRRKKTVRSRSKNPDKSLNVNDLDGPRRLLSA